MPTAGTAMYSRPDTVQIPIRSGVAAGEPLAAHRLMVGAEANSTTAMNASRARDPWKGAVRSTRLV